MLRKYFLSFVLLIGALTAFAADNAGTNPIIVGGNFSVQSNVASNTRGFNKAARDAEVASLREKLQNGKETEVIARINQLTLNNFLDDRFYLLLAIAYDHLNQDDNVIYAASQAISVSPQDPRAYLLRAGARLKKKDWENAQMDIDAALKLNPKSELARQYQKELREKQPFKRDGAVPTAKELAKQRTTPTWMTLYFVIVAVAILLFLYWRYEDLLHQPKNAFSRKEVEIKEQYDFIRQIGEGGMGKVYEAYDRVLNRRVAIKRVKPELVRNAYIREQFLSEARMVALLRHPCIVEIYTVIESESSLYLVFEYVDGQSLETRLDIDGRLPFSQAKKIFQHVCDGLTYAHAQDIVHCDLKPGNIMILEDDMAKVMDFGVARKTADHQTGARTVAGTPAYMAPEQQRGFMRKQSDVYSLALCLYEALVGQLPWTVKGFNVATKQIVPPSKVVEKVPAEVDVLLADALKEDPKERVQSIAEFSERLAAIEPFADDELDRGYY